MSRSGREAFARRWRGRIARGLMAAGLAATSVPFFQHLPAQAALTGVGAAVEWNPPATDTSSAKFPEWFEDSKGTRLTLCTDGPPLCVASASDLVAADGEAFWYLANADFTKGAFAGGFLEMAVEAAYAAEGVNQESAFSRIRFRARDVKSGTYRLTFPYGTQEFTADPVKGINSTEDIGCFSDCNDPLLPVQFGWGKATTSRVGPFLRWDPAVLPAAPQGYIGDNATLHKVVGSALVDSTGKPQNYVRVQQLTGPKGTPLAGGFDETVDVFTIQGKLAQPAAPPAPAPVASLNPTTLTAFASQALGTTSAAKTVTLSNSGNAPLTISSIGTTPVGGNDFSATNNCPSPLPAGSNCAISVTFTPTATGTRTGSLSVTTNATPNPQPITLSGTGAAATPPPVTDTTAPTISKAPTQTFVQNSTVTTAGLVPVTISWAATDPSGIKSYELQQSKAGGAFTAVTLPSVTATSIQLNLAAGSAYQYRVRATDGANNTATAFTLGPKFNLSAVQDNEASISYVGGARWVVPNPAPTGSWGTAKVNSGTNTGTTKDSAKLTFTGSVAWVSKNYTDRGLADILIDGTKVATIDTSTTNTAGVPRILSYVSPKLAGTHTIEIRVTGTKGLHSTGPAKVDLDAFVIMQ